MSLFGPPNVDKMAAKRNVEGLIKALGYRKDASVRNAAADALRRIGDARAVEPFSAALKGFVTLVREAAAKALELIKTAQAG